MKKIALFTAIISCSLGCGNKKSSLSTEGLKVPYSSSFDITYLSAKEEAANVGRTIRSTQTNKDYMYIIAEVPAHLPNSTLSLQITHDQVGFEFEFALDSKSNLITNGLEAIECSKDSKTCKISKVSFLMRGKRDSLGNAIEPNHVISTESTVKDVKFKIQSCILSFKADKAKWNHTAEQDKEGEVFNDDTRGEYSQDGKTTAEVTCSNGEKNILKASFNIRI